VNVQQIALSVSRSSPQSSPWKPPSLECFKPKLRVDLQAGSEVAQAVGALHDRGLGHRGISTSSVQISFKGEAKLSGVKSLERLTEGDKKHQVRFRFWNFEW
jgi:hypothetical protein